jgi:predicted phosphodiesterase
MTHIAGSPPNYNLRVRKILQTKTPDLLVCGHSHILKVAKDSKHNLTYINPGAAGHQGFHHMRTIMRFEITGKEITNMEVIELGKRGAIQNL